TKAVARVHRQGNFSRLASNCCSQGLHSARDVRYSCRVGSGRKETDQRACKKTSYRYTAVYEEDCEVVVRTAGGRPSQATRDRAKTRRDHYRWRHGVRGTHGTMPCAKLPL